MNYNLRTLYNIVFVVLCGWLVYNGQFVQRSNAYFEHMEKTSWIGPFSRVVEIMVWLIVLAVLNWLRLTLADAALAAYRHQTEGAPIDLTKGGDMTEQLRRQAKKMERKKDFAGSAEVYETLEDWENAGQMHSLAGQFTRAGAAFERCGNFEAAIDCFEREGEYELAGNAALRDGRRNDAARLFMLAAEQARENNRVQRAGELYEKGGHFERAGLVFQSLNRAEDALRNFEKSGNAAKVVEILDTLDFDNFLRRVQGGTELFRRCAELLAKSENFKVAGNLLDATGDSVRAGEMHAKAGDHIKAAESYFAAGQRDAAEESVSRVPDRVAAAEFRAKLAADRGDWIAAGEFYERADKKPQAIDAYKKAKAYDRAAKVLEDQGRFILAAEMYSMAKDFLAAGEAYSRGRDARNAAECFETAGEGAKAIEHYIQAGMHFQAGMVAFSAGDYSKAVDGFQRVAANSNDYRLAQGMLAASFFNINRVDMAADIYQRVIPDLSPARDTLAIFYWYARFLEDRDANQSTSVYKMIQGLDAGYEDVERRLRKVEAQTGWHTPFPATPEAPPSSGRAASAPAPLVNEPPPFPEPPPGLSSSMRLPAATADPNQAAPRDTVPAQTRALPVIGDPSRYRVMEQMGGDNLLSTFLAEDRDQGRLVQVRVFDVSNERSGHPDAMVDAARRLMRLAHPNVQSVWDAGRNNYRVYVSQERVDGESWPDILRRSGPPTPKDLAALLIQAADALAYAHSQEVVHLGFKPSCLVNKANGTLKVVNFGVEWLAVTAANKMAASTSEPAGPGVLDPSFLAPEQVTGQAVDPRTDIYSFGLVLFTLATGRNPFEIRRITNPIEIARMQVSSGFPMPSTIRATLPEQVDEVFGRCTSKNPAERYSSAEEVLDAVKRALLS